MKYHLCAQMKAGEFTFKNSV